MKITLDIEEEHIERIVRSLDNQHAYMRSSNFEDSGYKRLADLFRGFLKHGPGYATSLSAQMPVAPLLKPHFTRRCDRSADAKSFRLFDLIPHISPLSNYLFTVEKRDVLNLATPS